MNERGAAPRSRAGRGRAAGRAGANGARRPGATAVKRPAANAARRASASGRAPRKRRRGSVGPWLASVALLAVAVALVLWNIVFVVRDVAVVGSGEISAQEVARMSGIRLGTRMRNVDVESVREGVESDGRMAFVGLERRLPSHLVLTVRPRTRDALVMQGGKVLVLDSDAYVVEIADRLPEGNVPYVTGLRPSGYQLGRQLDTADGRCACMKAVLEAARAHNATGYISEISVADPNDLRIITRTGMTVMLGDAQNMENKIVWMAGAVADLEARGETSGRLDVTSGKKADYQPPETTGKSEEEQKQTEVGAADVPAS